MQNPIKDSLKLVALVLVVVAIGFFTLTNSGNRGTRQTATVYGTDINGTLSYNGQTRTYLLHVPNSYTTSIPVPLVLVFHGLQTNGVKMADITDFSPLADTNNFIVVYPDGINETWNPSDVGFVSALLDNLEQNYTIDANRVYAAGASMGGMFTNRLGIELADRFAAIGVVAGFLPSYSGTIPSPSRPLSVIQFHGTADPIISYTNKGIPALNYWLGTSADNCGSTPTVTQLPDLDPTDGTTVEKDVYTGCSGGNEVDFYKINNGGHTWPGVHTKSMPGVTSKDIDATALIWQFFSTRGLSGTLDTSAPAISMTAPSAGTVSGTITLSATSSDNVAVTKVEFYRDGSTLIGTDTHTTTSGSYSITWDTTTVADNQYSLTARAYDAVGNYADSTPIVVAVSNSTTVSTPSITSSDPTSPSTNTHPKLIGTAVSGSTVKIYRKSTCTGGSFTGTASAFASPGITVNTVHNSTINFYATATNSAGHVSACSSAFTYVTN